MGQKTKKNNGIKIIRKSNDLIESRYRFDIWETRLFSMILAGIRQEDEDFQVYRIHLKDIIREFDISNGNAYDLLRSAANSLMDKKFHINYEVDGAVREQLYHIIRRVDTLKQVLDEERRASHSYIEISVEPEMRPFLLELKSRFTAYDLRNVVKFKSGYTLRIYEHLKQYEKIGWRDFYIDYLRRTFELTEEYPLFANFYQKVIAPAERDINLYTDIQITRIDKIKEGAKVCALRFFFHSQNREEAAKARRQVSRVEEAPPPPTIVKEPDIAGWGNESPPTEPPPTDRDILFSRFQDVVVGELGVTPTAFLGLLQDRSAAQIEQAIRVTKRAKKERNLHNTAGFFVQAIKQGYTDPKEEAAKRKAQEEERKAMTVALEAGIETLKDEQALKISERTRTLTSSDPGVTLAAIEGVRQNNLFFVQRTEQELKRPLEVEDFRQDVFLRQFVKNEIVEQNKAYFSDVLSTFGGQINELEEALRALQRK